MQDQFNNLMHFNYIELLLIVVFVFILIILWYILLTRGAGSEKGDGKNN
jgi:hypothetical protein